MRIPYYSADWAALATDGCLESAVELYGIFIYGFFIYENLKYVARWAVLAVQAAQKLVLNSHI